MNFLNKVFILKPYYILFAALILSACAAGALCAAWISGDKLPAYADQLSMARYADMDLMAELENAQSLGIL